MVKDLRLTKVGVILLELQQLVAVLDGAGEHCLSQFFHLQLAVQQR